MSSKYTPVLHRYFLVLAIGLSGSIVPSLVLAEEIRSVGSLNNKSRVIHNPDVQSAQAQLGNRAPSDSVATPRSGEAISAPPLKNLLEETDQSSAEAATDDLPLSSARLITIKMHNYATLTGDYRINADQTISIPVLGRIELRDTTAAGLERIIVDKIEKITGHPGSASVEIAEYSPVFVNGYVEQAGAIPWAPGLTVLQAETLSGGLYRPRLGSASGEFAPDLDRMKYLAEIKRHTDDLKHTLAKLARASAERDKATQIDMPRRLVELAGAAEARELIDTQKNQLRLYQHSVAAERARLVQADALESETVAQLRRQQELVKRQIDMRDEQLRLLKGARVKGAITQERLLTVESLLASLQEKSTNIILADAEVQSAAASLKRESERLIQARQLELAKEIENLERDAVRLELKLAEAKEGYAMFARLTGNVGGPEDSNKGSVVQYEISRRERGEIKTILAERLSPLWPGDVLVIRLRDADAALAQSQ